MRDPKERLRDIFQAITNIERYLVRGKEAFASDELMATWMLHQLQIVGEAVRTLHDDVRTFPREIP